MQILCEQIFNSKLNVQKNDTIFLNSVKIFGGYGFFAYLCIVIIIIINNMKKLATIAVENSKKECLTSVKKINNEVMEVKNARKGAGEVIRLVRDSSTQGYMLQLLLGCPAADAAAASVAAVKKAVNTFYPFKDESGKNVKPSTAYIKNVKNGVIVVAKVYKEVNDYVVVLQRAARAVVKKEAQKKVKMNCYYLAAGEAGEQEITVDDGAWSVATAVEYRLQQQEEAARIARRAKK